MTYSYDDFLQIMAKLRAPDGCPWDREQTQHSLLPYLIEESAEVIEAVQAGNQRHICEELGDVLLQVVFQAQIAAEAGHFSMADVVQGIAEKMVRRHPHVFADAQADTADEVLLQWDKIKAVEKAQQPRPASVLDKSPRTLPTLTRAQELQKKAAKTGFTWPTTSAFFAKIREELTELEAAIASGTPVDREEELGDLLFAVVGLGRSQQIEAELALIRANAKFERRFRHLEAQAGGSDALRSLSIEDLLTLWEQAKQAD